MPFKDAITGTSTASLMVWSWSMYWSGPIENSPGVGKYDAASGWVFAVPSTAAAHPPSSRSICSSNSERITIADAPASSSRRTASRLSPSGDAPGISGESSWSPSHSVLRSMCPCPLEQREPLADIGLRLLDQRLVPFGVHLLDHPEPRLVAHVRGEVALRRPG